MQTLIDGKARRGTPDAYEVCRFYADQQCALDKADMGTSKNPCPMVYQCMVGVTQVEERNEQIALGYVLAIAP